MATETDEEISTRWRADYYRTARPDPERVVFDTPIPVENPYRRKGKTQILIDAGVAVDLIPDVVDPIDLSGFLVPAEEPEPDEFKSLFDNL